MRAFTKLQQYVHESNLIEGFDSEEADEALTKAWTYLKHQKHANRPLTNEMIKEVQKRVVSHQDNVKDLWPGAYRDRGRVNVWVGGREGLSPSLIQGAMDSWLEHWLENNPIENHITFEHIHPFVDGNGRTGRLLLWYQEFCYEGRQPTLIRNRTKGEYYKWF